MNIMKFQAYNKLIVAAIGALLYFATNQGWITKNPFTEEQIETFVVFTIPFLVGIIPNRKMASGEMINVNKIDRVSDPVKVNTEVNRDK